MSMQMQHGQHMDTLRFDKKVHTIGKVPKKRTMHRDFQARKLLWIVYDTTNHMVQLGKESLTQTGSLTFISNSSGLDVEFRLRLDD
jgi:acyl-ACP thioesterase